MPLVKTVDLDLGYDGRTVVNNVNIEINRGDFLCIVGENGSGKSTFMRTLLGLQKPLDGTLTFGDGLERTEIGYLPQQTAAQKDFPASVIEVVMSGCLNKCGLFPFFKEKHKRLARKNMEKLGITEFANRCYRELSGGQQQRVLLARALCASSELLLLDEPVAGLDPIVTAEMYDIINQLNSEGLTVVMISHDIAASVNYATHILHLAETPLFFGTKEDYLLSDVGMLLQAPTVCNCTPLISPLIAAVKNNGKFISSSPAIADLAQTVRPNPKSRNGRRFQKSTAPSAEKTTADAVNSTKSEDGKND